MDKHFVCEICCDTAENALAARDAGAHRVELCSALSCGGVTPSIAMIRSARALCGPDFPIHVLIRAREGDFTYSPAEVQTMAEDIREAVKAGASGVVIGALTPDGEIDMHSCRTLCTAARGVSITFSRAFDLAKNPEKALEDAISLGCHRILTSGGAPTAMQGAQALKSLNRLADGRIIILAASGINETNFRELMDATGVWEVHGSMRCPGNVYGYSPLPGLPNSRLVTSPEKVGTVAKSI